MKNGGTPLHWCLTKEVVVALVELVDCCVDARNFCGQTALHVMVQRERFECVVALLSRGGADPNLTDAVGNTPLHEALCGSGGNSSTNLLIVQVLVFYGILPYKIVSKDIAFIVYNLGIDCIWGRCQHPK